MAFINNDRYSTIIEDMKVYNNRFICAYLPVYGLVKIDGVVLKISGYEGIIYTDKNNIIIEYIREKIYIDGSCGKELNEKEIFEILLKKI